MPLAVVVVLIAALAGLLISPQQMTDGSRQATDEFTEAALSVAAYIREGLSFTGAATTKQATTRLDVLSTQSSMPKTQTVQPLSAQEASVEYLEAPALIISTSGSQTLDLQGVPRSLRVTGSIVGSGHVTIRVSDGISSWTVLDSDRLQNEFGIQSELQLTRFEETCIDTCTFSPRTKTLTLHVETDGPQLAIQQIHYTVVPIQETIQPAPFIVLLENADGNPIGAYTIAQNSDGTRDVELTNQPALLPPGTVPETRILIAGVTKPVIAKIGRVDDLIITTDVVAVETIPIKGAKLTIRKHGPVTGILSCPDFDLDTFTCPSQWLLTATPYTDDGDTITFSVNHFSAYAAGTTQPTLIDGTTTTIKQTTTAVDQPTDYGVILPVEPVTTTKPAPSVPSGDLSTQDENALCPGGTCDCGEAVTASGKVILTSADAITSTTCGGTVIHLEANDIELDCGGFTLRYAATTVGAGVNATGRLNVSIYNCTILANTSQPGSNGILFSGTNNSYVQNLTVRSLNNSNAISLDLSHNNSIFNVTGIVDVSFGTTTAAALSISSSDDINVRHATLFSNGGVGLSVTGPARRHNYFNISVSGGNTTAATITGLVLSNLSLMTVTANQSTALSLNRFQNSTLANITAASNASIALSLVGGDASPMRDNNFTNIAILTNATWITTNANAISNNFTNTTFSTGNGSIRFATNISLPASTTVDLEDLNITNATARLNSTNHTFLNTTAFITLNNLNRTNPGPTFDSADTGSFVSCPASKCTEISYTGGVFIFNVSSFTSFSQQETGGTPVNSCLHISTNGSYTLTSDVGGVDGSCINITSNNTHLDCQGFRVLYGNTASGVGVNVTGRNNVSVKNCVIIKNSTTAANNDGIRFTGTSTSFIENNIIWTNGTSANNGILLQTTSSNNVIINNTVYSNGSTTGANHALSITSGANMFIANNTLVASGGTGLTITAAGVGNNTVRNNTIASPSLTSTTTGIATSASTTNRILDNVLVLNTTGSVITAIATGSTTQVENNDIKHYRGVGITVGSISNVTRNRINITTGVSSDNVITVAAAATVNVTDNAIEINGTTSSTAISLGTAANAYRNNITFLRGTGLTGISVTTGADALIANNYINITSTVGTSITNVVTADGTSTGIRIFNNTLILIQPADGAGLTSHVIGLASAGASGKIRDNTLFSNKTWIRANLNYTFANNTFVTDAGSIRVITESNFQNRTNISQRTLNISNKVAYMNSTNLTYLNTSSVITLNGVTFTNAQATYDSNDDGTFEVCPSNKCTEISYAGGVFKFNVSSFTAFSSQEHVLSCGDTLSTNTTLNTSYTATGTCFTINTSGLTLDCRGNNITFGTGGGASPIAVDISADDDSTLTNITVKNCTVIGHGLGSSAKGITASNITNSFIRNNTIILNGTGVTYGVHLFYTRNTNVSLNSVSSNVSAVNGGDAIILEGNTDNNSITYNAINPSPTVTGSGYRGILFTTVSVDTPDNNTVQFNNISADIGIISDSYDNIIALNNIGQTNPVTSTGISITGVRHTITSNNITVNKTVDSGGRGIVIGTDSVVRSNIVVVDGNSTNTGFLLASNVTVSSNTLTVNSFVSDSVGVSVGSGGINNNVTGNTINVTGGASSTGVIVTVGVGITGNHTIANNAFSVSSTNGSDLGIRLGAVVGGGQVNTTVRNNTLTMTGANSTGFDFLGTSGVNLTNNRLNATGASDLGLNLSFGAGNNTATDNNLTVTSGTGILFEETSVNNTLTNTFIRAGRDWIVLRTLSTGNNITNTTFVTNNGSIRVVPQATLPSPENITLRKLNITNGVAYMNSTNLTYLNLSSFITLNGVTFSNPGPTFDSNDDGTFETCPASKCTEVSYSGGIFVFNVSSFTAFGAEDAGATTITSCPYTISVPGLYALGNSVSSAGTCIFVQSSDVVLNCAGFTIDAGNSLSGSAGINVSSASGAHQNNVTIGNCTITIGAAGVTSTVGVLVDDTGNLSFASSTITGTDGDGLTTGVRLGNSSNANITSNTITTGAQSVHVTPVSGGTPSPERARIQSNTLFTNEGAINVQGLRNSLVTGNAITVNGTATATIAIWSQLLGSGNVFSDNTITANTGGVQGIRFDGETNSNITRNTLTLTGNGTGLGHVGIILANTTLINASSNTITLNSINARQAVGVALQAGNDRTENLTLWNNTITINGTGGNNTGIQLSGGGVFITFAQMRMTVNGVGNNSGIVMHNVNVSTIRLTNISVNDNGSAEVIGVGDNLGIAGTYIRDATITNNSVSVRGSYTKNSAIRLVEFNDTLIEGNNVTVNGSDDIYAINLRTGLVGEARNVRVLSNTVIANATLGDAAALHDSIDLVLGKNITVSFNTFTIQGAGSSSCMEVARHINSSIANNTCSMGDDDDSYGIHYTDSPSLFDNIRMENNTFNLKNTTYIAYIGGDNSTFTKNTLIGDGGCASCWGILTTMTDSVLANNSIYLYGNSSSVAAYGISMGGSGMEVVNNLIIMDETRTSIPGDPESQYAFGIGLDSGGISYNITNNTINMNGTNVQVRGINQWAGSGGTYRISKNKVFTNGNFTTNGNHGIYILAGAGNNNITNNTVTPNGTTDNHGIVLIGGTSVNRVVQNNITLAGARGIGVVVNESGTNVVESNIITWSINSTPVRGILLLDDHTFSIDTVLNNISLNNITFASFSAGNGIGLSGGANNTVDANRLTLTSTASSTFGFGILVFNTTQNNVTRNTITYEPQFAGTNQRGIMLDISHKNFIGNNTINLGNETGGRVQGLIISGSNNTFTNNTIRIRNNTQNGDWIGLNGLGISGTGNNLTNNVFERNNGSIRVPTTVTIPNGTFINLSKLNITNLVAYLNSTNLSFLNTSAFITLNGITFVDPRPIFDSNDDSVFENCPTSKCTEISYAGGVFTFNVSSWTAFSANESEVLSINLIDAAIDLGTIDPGFQNDSDVRLDWFNITNNGTIIADIYGHGIASPFSGFSNNSDKLPNEFWLIHVNFTSSGSPNFTYARIPNSTFPHLLVDNLSYTAGSNSALIGIRARVPADENSGNRTAIITITGLAS